MSNNIYGYPLTYTLQHFDKFKELSPPQQQAILMNAQKFESHFGSHFLTPDELAEQLGGNPATWRQFLVLKPVQDYITRKVREDTDILNRKALFKQADKAAKTGDNQAAKYLNALAEANAAQTNQRTVVLHYVKRPDTESSSDETPSKP